MECRPSRSAAAGSVALLSEHRERRRTSREVGGWKALRLLGWRPEVRRRRLLWRSPRNGYLYPDGVALAVEELHGEGA